MPSMAFMPSVEKLAELVERCERLILTVVDAEGHPHTIPLQHLKVPFKGHLWFRMHAGSAAARAIGRGSEATVACGDAAARYGATLYGWAVVLSDPVRVGGVAYPSREPSTVLVCVTTSAAELWSEPSTETRRVIALSTEVPTRADVRTRQGPPFRPTLASERGVSCAS